MPGCWHGLTPHYEYNGANPDVDLLDMWIRKNSFAQRSFPMSLLQ